MIYAVAFIVFIALIAGGALFIKARNAQSDRTAIQGYGPQYKPREIVPNKPIPDNRPKPPEPPRKGDV